MATKFDIWWNSPKIKRINSIAYSVGASVVIIGALFKIMHYQFADVMLLVGMSTEAILFALGAFDKPHREYEWDKVFSFNGEGVEFKNNVALTANTQPVQSFTAPNLSGVDVSGLSASFQSLSETANQLSALQDIVAPTKNFVKNIESASDVAAKFAETQLSLNKVTSSLFTSYDALNNNMGSVVGNTTQFAEKVGEINKNLSSINSIYEIQIKNIQSQSDAVAKQTESTRLISQSLNEIADENQKMKSVTKVAVEEINKYKDGSAQLANQIGELNKVYGNMLNALN